MPPLLYLDSLLKILALYLAVSNSRSPCFALEVEKLNHATLLRVEADMATLRPDQNRIMKHLAKDIIGSPAPLWSDVGHDREAPSPRV